MEPAWLIDGNPTDLVPADDRGLAYGDGVFETIAAPDGRLRHFERHYERLRNSCVRLGFGAPSRERLHSEITRLSTAGESHIIKIIVTRGSAGRGYRPPANPQPRRLVARFPWPEYPAARYRNGIRVIWCETRLGENPALAGIKHLCRLEQVLAQRELADTDVPEGLMRSVSGAVIGGTMSNLFAVIGSDLVTPCLDQCGVAGVMRAAVVDTAVARGIRVAERAVMPEELLQAEEVFLSNSVFGIWPVSVLGDVAFSVGALTQSLMRDLDIHAT
jgi:4-amino-4-deoxychorismate lyase